MIRFAVIPRPADSAYPSMCALNSADAPLNSQASSVGHIFLQR
jgi:hypothetical protein